MGKRLKLNADYVRSLLLYNPLTGNLWWRSQRGTRSDLMLKPAGNINKLEFYRCIVIDGAIYPAHRLIWLMKTGEWPKHEIDHINGIRDDNRWINLREADHSQNQRNARLRSNNRCGLKGVYQRREDKYRLKKWCALIRYGGRQRTIGYFRTKEEAHAAYVVAAREHHGEFANVG